MDAWLSGTDPSDSVRNKLAEGKTSPTPYCLIPVTRYNILLVVFSPGSMRYRVFIQSKHCQ